MHMVEGILFTEHKASSRSIYSSVTHALYYHGHNNVVIDIIIIKNHKAIVHQFIYNIVMRLLCS